MSLSYAERLACVVALSLGLLQLAAELLLRIAAPFLLRLFGTFSVRQRERALYIVQLIPFVFALAFTASITAPRYIANETNFGREGVGWLCLSLTLAFYSWWAIKIVSAALITRRTAIFNRDCKVGSDAIATSSATPILMSEGSGARVALVGFIRPFIVISRSLMEHSGVDPFAWDIVFEHERAHAAQRDNWKLLSLYCLPRLNLKVSQGRTWMQLWQNSSEWAADEDAVRGSTDRALLLAGTLVTLARSRSANPNVVCTYLVNADSELAERVERLIRFTPQKTLPHGVKPYVILGSVVVTTAILIVSLTPALGELPEHLLHLG